MSHFDLPRGIRAHKINTHIDGRGMSAHDLFGADPEAFNNGQINVSAVMPGIIKAFHWHRKQSDRWVGIGGTAHVVTVDYGIRDMEIIKRLVIMTDGDAYDPITDIEYNDPKIQHFYLGSGQPTLLVIPPGVLHGYRALFNQPATILYSVTEKYDPSVPDEFRVHWDAFGKEVWETKNE